MDVVLPWEVQLSSWCLAAGLRWGTGDGGMSWARDGTQGEALLLAAALPVCPRLASSSVTGDSWPRTPTCPVTSWERKDIKTSMIILPILKTNLQQHAINRVESVHKKICAKKNEYPAFSHVYLTNGKELWRVKRLRVCQTSFTPSLIMRVAIGAWPWPKERAWKRLAIPLFSASWRRPLVGSCQQIYYSIPWNKNL